MIKDMMYSEKGYYYINAFVDKLLYNDVRSAFDKGEYERIDQVRFGRYKIWTRNNGPWPDRNWPSQDEDYIAKFWYCREVLQQQAVKTLIKEHIEPFIKKYYPSMKSIRHQATKMKRGMNDSLRCHYDDYTASVGYIYYVTGDEWKYDWGGLLHMVNPSKDDEIETVLPQPGKLVIVDHASRLPHWVTSVNYWSKYDRNTLVGFATERSLDDLPDTWKNEEFYMVNEL